jgi:hypothetical protein
MCRLCRVFAAAAWLWILLALSATAAPPPDPLRFISDKANLVLKVENPRKLIEAVRALDAFKQAEQLDGARNALDTAQVRRFFEFIAYYETDLGAAWPDLLDKLAGGGIAVGSTINNPADNPVLFAVQARDEALLAKFLERAVEVLEQEMARTESKDKVVKDDYRGVDVLHFGKDLHACRIGSALLFANQLGALKAGIDQNAENDAKGVELAKNAANSTRATKARTLLPKNPDVWAWYDLAYLKGRPEAKELLVSRRNNTPVTVLFAGYLDVVRRAEFVAVGLYEQKDGFSLSVRMPAGRDGMADDVELHLPRDAKAGGSLPLLEPPGVIFSHSFYLDAGALWTKRGQIMSEQNLKQFEKGVKDASRFLPGASIDKLLIQSGVHHRIVAVQRALTAGYKTEPQVRVPASAFITTMRDPAYGKSMELLVRGGVALASTQVSVKLFEDRHADVPLFGYTFPEDGKFPNDPQGIRFNFTPSFAVVGDQIVFASTKELCIELIDILQRDDRSRLDPQNMQMRVYATGFGDLLNASPDQLLAQTILNQAVSEAQAKKQVDQLLKYLRTLGSVRVATDYTDNEFHFDVEWKAEKQ